MITLGDACTEIDDTLGDPTVIAALGDASVVISLENPSVIFVALDSSTVDVTVAFTTTLEDSAAELLSKKCAIEKTILSALIE